MGGFIERLARNASRPPRIKKQTSFIDSNLISTATPLECKLVFEADDNQRLFQFNHPNNTKNNINQKQFWDRKIEVIRRAIYQCHKDVDDDPTAYYRRYWGSCPQKHTSAKTVNYIGFNYIADSFTFSCVVYIHIATYGCSF